MLAILRCCNNERRQRQRRSINQSTNETKSSKPASSLCNSTTSKLSKLPKIKNQMSVEEVRGESSQKSSYPVTPSRLPLTDKKVPTQRTPSSQLTHSAHNHNNNAITHSLTVNPTIQQCSLTHRQLTHRHSLSLTVTVTHSLSAHSLSLTVSSLTHCQSLSAQLVGFFCSLTHSLSLAHSLTHSDSARSLRDHFHSIHSFTVSPY